MAPRFVGNLQPQVDVCTPSIEGPKEKCMFVWWQKRSRFCLIGIVHAPWVAIALHALAELPALKSARRFETQMERLCEKGGAWIRRTVRSHSEIVSDLIRISRFKLASTKPMALRSCHQCGTDAWCYHSARVSCVKIRLWGISPLAPWQPR